MKTSRVAYLVFCAMLFAVASLACDQAAQDADLLEPQVEESSSMCADCDGTDGSGELTDADYARLLPARIYSSNTMVKLSMSSVVSTAASMTFSGSKGTIESEEDIYWDGKFVTRLKDSGEYRETVWDWLNKALGYCSGYNQLVDGQVLICPHEVKAEINDIKLDPECGHSIIGRSDHKAEMLVKSRLWSSATDRSSDNKAQSSCPPPDGGTHDGATEVDEPTCSTATCVTYYWKDTGEIVFQTCWCSS